MVWSGKAADLATVVRMCRISRARVSKLMEMMGMAEAEQEMVIGISSPLDR